MLVTGAAGRVGREVVRAVRARGMRVRAAAPSVEVVHALHGPDVEAVQLDVKEPSSFDQATSACETMFLVRPTATADVHPSVNALVDAAVGNGVGHVVFLSVAGVGESPLVPHYLVEQHLKRRASDCHTLLRPGFFAQNLGDIYRLDIAEDDRLFVPASHGRVAFVDVRDVADVAAMILEKPDLHRGKAYTLTGPAAVSFEEVATLLTEVLGRSIQYESASVVGYVRHLYERGLPLGQVAMQTLLHVGLRYGQAERVDHTMENLLGHRGRTVERYVSENEHLWQRGQARAVAHV